MIRAVRQRLTYANVVASFALFIALGGVSYAAATLPKNSVGTTQIKKNAVTGAKVRNASLTGADIKDGSITSADVAGGLSAQSAGAQGPAGPKGDAGAKGETGAKGDTGATGPSDAYVAPQIDSFDSSTSLGVVSTVTVPAGSYVVNGKLYGIRPPGGSSTLLCYLFSGADSIDLENGGNNTDTNQKYVQLSFAGHTQVTADTNITIQCSGNGSVFSLYGVQLQAIKVGTLHIQAP